MRIHPCRSAASLYTKIITLELETAQSKKPGHLNKNGFFNFQAGKKYYYYFCLYGCPVQGDVNKTKIF